MQTIALPRASQPFGIVFAPTGSAAFVALEATGAVLKLDAASGATLGTVDVGPNPRHLSISARRRSPIYVSRFITPPLPGEGTALVQTAAGGGEVVALVGESRFAVARTITLAHSDRPDFESQGRGIPNYLGAAVISPDGTQAWVPSKQDNIARGALRDGANIDFQNTVRAISSRIDLAAGTEDPAARIDHDNSSVASAVAFDPRGVYLFVALETSREVAVVDAHGQLGDLPLRRRPRAAGPRGVAGRLAAVRQQLHGPHGRRVRPAPLLHDRRRPTCRSLATLNAVATERLTAQRAEGQAVLLRRARHAPRARPLHELRDAATTTAASDGRVWDLTGMGEGLRNTISLDGRGGDGARLPALERQLRRGAGLRRSDPRARGRHRPDDRRRVRDAQRSRSARPKAGVSADLDALAAYVASLSTFRSSPYRNADGSLTSDCDRRAARCSRTPDCGSCHGGANFTDSGAATLMNVGTIKPTSGQRLGATLTGIDPPTLRDVWATAPYLHDGSAATLADAVRAHTGVIAEHAPTCMP